MFGPLLLVLTLGAPAVDPVASLVDAQSLNFPRGEWGTCINGQTFAQEAIVSQAGYQYTASYTDGGAIRLSRRALPAGAWESFTLDDYRITHTDVHNVAVIGLCPLDGTLHLAFDHHGHRLHYRRSRPGVISDPSRVAWSADLMGATQDHLVPGQPETQVTYPMFVTTPHGSVQLLWRRGSSGDGDWHLAEYDPAAGGWTRLGLLLSRRGQYQTSDRRCAYPNPLRYDSRGRLHLTWCWREPGPLTSNHDLCYAYSDDRGRTWRNAAGDMVARLGDEQPSAITVTTVGIIARPTPWHWGQMNTTTQHVDARGRVHVVNWQTPAEARAGGLDMNQWRYDHYWNDERGEWHEQRLPMAGRKPQMVVGADGTAWLVYLTGGDANYHNVDDGGLLTIATAPEAGDAPKGEWREWRTLWQSRERYVGEPLLDQARWQRDGVLSVYCQTKPGQPGAPSPLHVLDYAPASR